MSLGEVQPTGFRPKRPASRERMYVGITFIVVALSIALLLWLKKLPGIKETETSPSVISDEGTGSARLNEDQRRKLAQSQAAGRRYANDVARGGRGELNQIGLELAKSMAQSNAKAARSIQRPEVHRDAEASRKKRLAGAKKDIERYLAPLTTPGHQQPVQGATPLSPGPAALVWMPESEPMSLYALRKVGILDDDENGMVWLHWVASSPSNDRPRWSEPYNDQRTATAHELLLKYAEDMVAEGWLSP